MPKISALATITSPDGDDELAIVDDSASTTKKITLTGLKTWFQSLVGWITADMIASGSVVKVSETIMVQAKKTANQTISGSGVITFESAAEYKGTTTFDTSTERWTLPANGWVEITITVSFDNGPVAEDTHKMHVRKNGTPVNSWTTNWPAHSASGVENTHTYTAGFEVEANDYIDFYFAGFSAGNGTRILAGTNMTGRFTPDYT